MRVDCVDVVIAQPFNKGLVISFQSLEESAKVPQYVSRPIETNPILIYSALR
jgi:hypothetical protein